MATLTIRDLDESLKHSLRLRAAGHRRSMEEEVRQILRAVLQPEPTGNADLATRIRARFKGLGDVDLPLAPREPVRLPPDFGDSTTRVSRTARKR